MIESSVDFVRFNSRAVLSCTGKPPFCWELDGKGQLETVGDNAIFTAPNDLMDDVSKIICVDSENKKHTLSLGFGDEVMILLDIIKHELKLSSDQLHINYQKFNIPNDERLYITGQYLNSRFFNNGPQRENEDFQTININSTIQIDMMSKDSKAVNNQHTLVMALASPYAKKQQLNSGIRIFGLPSQMNNTSFLEGASGINRFTATFNITYSKIIEKSQDYYDTVYDEIIVRS